MSSTRPTNIEIRRLLASDLVDGFDAGPAEDEVKLTGFFRRNAKKNQALRRSVTWVAIVDGSIAGYMTLTPGNIVAEDIQKFDKSHPNYPAPVLLMGRLATDHRFRRKGIGAALVDVAMSRAEHLAGEHGCTGMFLEAAPAAVDFYLSQGFGKLREKPIAPGTYLPMYRHLDVKR